MTRIKRKTIIIIIIINIIIIILAEELILPVVLYGRKTWSLTLREECMLKVFKNRILRQIFGPNGEWRRLHNEELHSLYRSPNIARVIKSRRLRWAGHSARMEEDRSVFKILTDDLQERDL